MYFPFEGIALKNSNTARKNPCQYEAKMTSLTVRNYLSTNFPFGREGDGPWGLDGRV